jgi:hypothetical protein
MQRWRVEIIPVVLALWGIAPQPTPAQRQPDGQGSSVRYIAQDKKGIVLTSPSAQEWRSIAAAPPLIAHFLAVKSKGTSISIAAVPAKDYKTLPANFPETLAAENKSYYPSYKQTAKQAVTVAGETGWQIDGQYQLEELKSPTRNRQVFVLHNGIHYIFTLTGDKKEFSQFTPALEALVKSAHWISPPAARKKK